MIKWIEFDNKVFISEEIIKYLQIYDEQILTNLIIAH